MLRSSVRRAFVVAVIFGALALPGGCANDSRPDDAVREIDKQEQEYLQERIQKGIAKRPLKSPR